MVTQTNKVALPVKVNKKLKLWLQKEAKRQEKKVSPFVEEILNDKMKNNGR